MAEIYGAYQVSEVIVALSGMFRYAAHSPGFGVTIGEELRNLKNYMKIVNARFGGGIDCLVDVPEDGNTNYYRDENDVHYVPKRTLADELLN